ncbi:MAG: pyruvate dehydrogenase complex dihydrolipoamide acetyltransferase, partial [Enterovirga sp.]|nr:pyruvate dehydrogenase complex dihydrolipoamide acetyltransferase [Enterovirga sp.]
MPTNNLMPALSPTMEKGNLAKWLKKEGDTIKSGDVLAEIETDKATMEVEAVDEGVLARITVPDGTADVPVNQIIGVIAAEGEDPKNLGEAAPAAAAPKGSAPAAEAKVAPAEVQPAYARANVAPDGPAKPAGASGPQPSPTTNGAAAPAGEGGRVFASPLARRMAKEGGLDLGVIQGSGPHGRVVQADVKAAIAGGTAKAGAA